MGTEGEDLRVVGVIESESESESMEWVRRREDAWTKDTGELSWGLPGEEVISV